jgi:hypothetical protein
MSRTRNSAIDVLGITLGVIAILIVVGSVVTIARGRMFDARWSFLGRAMPWNDGDFSFGPAVREEKDEVVPAGATEIEVRNIAGSIEINGNPGASAIAVHSVKTAPFRGALDRVRVDIQKEGNRLVVAEKHDSGFLRNAGTVSFQVVVPRGLKVIDAHSVSGGITVQGVEPGIDQDLSGGSMLNVRSVSGSIDGVIESLGNDGTAHLGTVSGSVTLNAFAALDAKVSLHTLSGNVSCGFPLTISEQKKNRLNGTIGKGSAKIDVGTVSGSISISKM